MAKIVNLEFVFLDKHNDIKKPIVYKSAIGFFICNYSGVILGRLKVLKHVYPLDLLLTTYLNTL